ncbi:ATP synthase subunit I [Avibacterium sp. 21-595]|uniref:ATP synthase subunit I n=1 Tax=Avibacterium sp. 21-595 TaxID=2911527 RepID=UPI0020274674|nr:ATP synthase subunit I [Avibacterium sp. 21-595]URL06626.1 ATP synthase subunit I [Avibacterium sp. 21-595]
MSKILQQTRKQYYRILVIEGLLISLLTLSAFLLLTDAQFLSLFAGMICAFVPQLCFLWIMFSKNKKDLSQQVKRLYQSEGIKFGITVILFSICLLNLNPILPLPLFSGYFGVIIANNLFPLLFSHHTTINS